MITTTSSASEVYHAAKKIKGHKVFFLDVDHTLIWPTSLTLRTNQHHHMIDEIKKNILDAAQYVQMIGHWRLQRNVALTDVNWPVMIEEIKKESEVYGLTRVETGEFGPIPSMEKWRINELYHLDIIFSENKDMESISTNQGPSYHKGCLLTGKKTKLHTLKIVMNFFRHSSQSIVMVDDKIEEIKLIQNFCMKNNIGFTGFLWKMPLMDSCPATCALAEKQKQSLWAHYKWIEC